MTELSSPVRSASRRSIKVNALRGEAEFDRARRRTRLVKRLKVILPATALLAIGVFFAAYQMAPKNQTVSMSGLNLDQKSLTIEKPRMSGFKGTAQSYDLSAERAVQDLSNPKVVRLEAIAGSFGVQTDGSATMAATTGIYDSDAGTLLLTNGVSVKTTTGFDLSLAEAALDFRQKTLISATPVVIKTGEGEIRANAVHVSEGGHKVIFENGVSVTYLPKAGDGIAAAPAPAGP